MKKIIAFLTLVCLSCSLPPSTERDITEREVEERDVTEKPYLINYDDFGLERHGLFDTQPFVYSNLWCSSEIVKPVHPRFPIQSEPREVSVLWTHQPQCNPELWIEDYRILGLVRSSNPPEVPEQVLVAAYGFERDLQYFARLDPRDGRVLHCIEILPEFKNTFDADFPALLSEDEALLQTYGLFTEHKSILWIEEEVQEILETRYLFSDIADELDDVSFRDRSPPILTEDGSLIVPQQNKILFYHFGSSEPYMKITPQDLGFSGIFRYVSVKNQEELLFFIEGVQWYPNTGEVVPGATFHTVVFPKCRPAYKLHSQEKFFVTKFWGSTQIRTTTCPQPRESTPDCPRQTIVHEGRTWSYVTLGTEKIFHVDEEGLVYSASYKIEDSQLLGELWIRDFKSQSIIFNKKFINDRIHEGSKFNINASTILLQNNIFVSSGNYKSGDKFVPSLFFYDQSKDQFDVFGLPITSDPDLSSGYQVITSEGVWVTLGSLGDALTVPSLVGVQLPYPPIPEFQWFNDHRGHHPSP